MSSFSLYFVELIPKCGRQGEKERLQNFIVAFLIYLYFLHSIQVVPRRGCSEVPKELHSSCDVAFHTLFFCFLYLFFKIFSWSCTK